MGNGWALGASFDTMMFLLLNSQSKSLESTSCPKMSKYEESGSPCLSLLLGMKLSDLPPFTIILKVTKDMQTKIQLVKVLLNPR